MNWLKRFFSASWQEWPYAFFARNILVLGLAACALFAAIALVNPPIPAYGELTVVQGTYQGLERQSDGSYELAFTAGDGYTDLCLIDSFVYFPRDAFLEAVKPGDPIALRYGPDEHQTVMELTAAGETFLTYEETYRATWNNNYLGLILSTVGTVVLMAALWLWLWVKKRRTRAEPAPESETPVPQVLPAGYAPGEREAVEQYIQKAFGRVGRVYYDMTQGEAVDIAVIPPTERENFYRLVTVGMGARRMDVPRELRETNLAFAELAVFLPPDWDPDGAGEESQWPFHWLRRVAGEPWVNAGSVFRGRIGEYTAVLAAYPQVREGCTGRLLLENGKVINFYQLYPLLPEEETYRKLRGVQHLWDRMKAYEVSPIVMPNRESCCDPSEWFRQDIAPFDIGEQDGRWYAWLSMKELGPHYRHKAFPRDSGGWLKLARRFCARYGWTEGLELKADPDYFSITSKEEDILRPFLLAFHDFCEDPEQVRELRN